MKIAFIYGQFSLGNRPINLLRMRTDKRGLTGSELSCIEFARGMAARGHDVELFLPLSEPERVIDGVQFRSLRGLLGIDASYDVAYAWNEPDLLREVGAKFRMVNQQLNDFVYCRPRFDHFVDCYTSPSQTHLDYVAPLSGSPLKWEVLPNGCDSTKYRGKKVPGRVVYASSPDRGLHLLLSVWPKIKEAVPGAHLKVFYEMGPWLDTFLGHDEIHMQRGEVERGLTETGYRARYVSLALDRLSGLSVTRAGSVSRDEMAREMSQAQCLAYPCATIRFTEGFSVSTLEGCASGAVPVIMPADALGQIYAELPTIATTLEAFTENVIRVLTDPAYAAIATATGARIADQHQWTTLTNRLENIIKERTCDKHESSTAQSTSSSAKSTPTTSTRAGSRSTMKRTSARGTGASGPGTSSSTSARPTARTR